MKKIYLFLAVVLLATMTAQSKGRARFSYYYASPNTTTGTALHSDLGWVTFATFDGQSDGGLFTLQDGVFVTSYTGLVKLTGNCSQGKPSNISLRVIVGNGLPVTIASTSSDVFSFVYPFMAGNVQIQGYNYNVGRYDIIKCALLFEAVG